MKYFIDKDNKVYAYEEDGSQDSYIKEGLTAISQEEAIERIKQQRKLDYENESDPLFFKAQRGDVPMEAWLAKIDEIKKRYPES